MSSARRAPRAFGHVETWVFDLDNTLYPHHLNLWQQVDERIRDYIAAYLKVTQEEAFRLQKDYYKRYGTSMRGADDRTRHEARRLSRFRASDRSFAPHSERGAGRRNRGFTGAQADLDQRYAPTCRRRLGASRARPALRGRVRHHRG